MSCVVHSRAEPLEPKGEYGFDGSLAGLVAIGAGGLILAGLALLPLRRGQTLLAVPELLGSLALVLTLASYLYSTRRGKFAVWAEVLGSLRLQGNEHVLDMGCGRGAVLCMLAKLVPQGQVVGLDLWRTADQSGNSPGAARRNLVAEGVSGRTALQTGDMTALPFADAAFDLVASSLAIHNIREAEGRCRAVDEAVRVLKPGGRVVIADLMWTGEYATRLRARGMEDVEQRRLGWRFWYGGPWAPTGLVTAAKPR